MSPPYSFSLGNRPLPRLLLLATLLGCSLTASADSSLQLPSSKEPAAVATCLRQGIHQLKIPDDYVKATAQDDGVQRIQLLNPATGQSSLQVEIQPQGEHSLLNVSQNGIPLTKPWLRLIKRCAG
ncbi:MAG: hypothetical protein JO338_01025 [Aquitalea sp.]|nr:hypothetical protein [Aquitalea sp.]